MSLTWHTPISQGKFPKDFYLSIELYHIFEILVNMYKRALLQQAKNGRPLSHFVAKQRFRQ